MNIIIFLNTLKEKCFFLLQTYLFLMEGKLFYNAVSSSAIHPHESATGICVSPPSLSSLPAPTPSHPSRLLQSPDLSSELYG